MAATPQPEVDPNAMDEDTKLRQFKTWFRVDRDHSADWRKAAKEDFGFFAGNGQWTDQEKQILKDQMRPIITFNRTNPVVKSISGIEISNRQEVKFFPRELGDSQADEVLTSAAEWFRDLSNADDEDSDMFQDVVICGLGCTETTLSFDDDEAGAPVLHCTNPLEMYWDQAARKKNFTDATRRWRVRQMPVARAKELAESLGAEKVSIDDLDAWWAGGDDATEKPIDRERARLYQDEGEQVMARDETQVTIAHLQYLDHKEIYDVTDPQSGQKVQVPVDAYQKLKERADMVGVQIIAEKRKVKVIRTAILGSKILADMEALVPDNFQFQFVTADIDRNTGLPYGIMSIMKDPQRWANKWMSQAMHILNTNAKGGVMVEDDAVEDVREFEKTYARNDKVTVVAAGALQNAKIQPKAQPSMDASFYNMMNFAIQSIPQVTGVNVELLGLREANQAASLESQRRQAGMTILQPLFDNLKRYRRDQGKVMLYMIQKILPKLDPDRLIRIVGDGNAQYVPLALQADVKYDIIVDDQVNSPDKKTEIMKILAPYLPGLDPKVMVELLDLLPIPKDIVDRIRKVAQPEPDPKQEQMADIQFKAQLEGNNAETAKDQAAAEKSTAEAQQIQAETALIPPSPFHQPQIQMPMPPQPMPQQPPQGQF